MAEFRGFLGRDSGTAGSRLRFAFAGGGKWEGKNSIFFWGKNCRKIRWREIPKLWDFPPPFFEMVRKMEGTRDGSRSNKEKMPFKCATRRHFRLISAYAETASSPGGISISHETLIRFASLATHPFHFPHFTKGGSTHLYPY